MGVNPIWANQGSLEIKRNRLACHLDILDSGPAIGNLNPSVMQFIDAALKFY